MQQCFCHHHISIYYIYIIELTTIYISWNSPSASRTRWKRMCHSRSTSQRTVFKMSLIQLSFVQAQEKNIRFRLAVMIMVQVKSVRKVFKSGSDCRETGWCNQERWQCHIPTCTIRLLKPSASLFAVRALQCLKFSFSQQWGFFMDHSLCVSSDRSSYSDGGLL